MVEDMGNAVIVLYATVIVAIGTIAALFIHWYYYRQQNIIAKNEINYYAMLEIMKIFNDTETARKRDILYSAFRDNRLYKNANGDIAEHYNFSADVKFYRLPEVVASVRGSFDQMGKLVKEEYVQREEFLEMYCDPVIRMGKVLKRHIIRERERRGHGHFMIYFDEIFNDARIYWEREFPNIPEPDPF